MRTLVSFLFLISSVWVLAVGSVLANQTRLSFCAEELTENREYTCQARSVFAPKADTLGSTQKDQPARALTLADYSRWQEIQAPTLSPDGKWVAYTLQTAPTLEGACGNRVVVVRSTVGSTEYRFPLGHAAEEGSLPSPSREAGSSMAFTADSRFLVFTVAAVPQGAPQPSGGAGAPAQRFTLMLVHLLGGQVHRVPTVLAFKLPKYLGRWLGYWRGANAGHLSAGQTREGGHTLVIRELATGVETILPQVTAFEFDDQGTYVAYAVSATQSERDGVYVRQLTDGTVHTLLSGIGNYRSLMWDHAGRQLAFLATRDVHTQVTSRYSLYLSPSPDAAAHVAVATSALPEDMGIAPQAGVQFTPTSQALTFMIAPLEAKAATPKTSNTSASFELWHWQQSAMLPNGERPLTPFPGSVSAWHFAEKTYLSVYHIRERVWAQLETPGLREVLLSEDGRHALGLNRGAYALRKVWEPWTFDLYQVDVRSGGAQRIRERVQPSSVLDPAWKYFFQLSPAGHYVLFVEDDRWWVYQWATGAFTNLTGQPHPRLKLGVGIRNRWQGTAGWTPQDRRVLLYDEHDLWAFDPSEQAAPQRLTDGRERQMIFRAVHERTAGRMGVAHTELVRQERSPHRGWQVDDTKPLLLEAQSTVSGDVGLWRLDWAVGSTPQPLLMRAGKRVTGQAQARDASQVLLTMESYEQYPDLWTGADLSRLSRISAANPQQREYLWGSEELIEFTSAAGALLKGRLYKPEGFDPRRRYPLIVFVYQAEALRMVRRHGAPSLQTDTYSMGSVPTPLTSRGYVALQPDIATVTGAPMRSAVEAIVPAVQAMLDRGYIDPARIALTGHSFGGFETLFTLTQAPGLFRCAVAAAGGVDLVAGYGSQSFDGTMPGFSEHGQLVMGVSPWKDPQRYLRNSAVRYADRVTTPLLMMHNEQDHAVSYAQSFQFFAALRRLGKETYLYNYLGEGHTLSKHVNIVDWNRRMDEFLDHCLKDAPRPPWMMS